MGLIGFIILGLIAGSIARHVMYGENKSGCLSTMLLGIIGANVGGWIGMRLFNVPLANFWSLQTWTLAIIGSVLILFIWSLLTGRKN